jgi:hypothetical protein
VSILLSILQNSIPAIVDDAILFQPDSRLQDLILNYFFWKGEDRIDFDSHMNKEENMHHPCTVAPLLDPMGTTFSSILEKQSNPA